MNFDRTLTLHLVVPGAITTALLLAAAVSPSTRAATIPFFVAVFTGLFAYTHLPHAAQILVRDPAYRNTRNYASFILALIGALAPLGFLALFVGVILMSYMAEPLGSGA